MDIKARFAHATAKKILKEKYEAKMLFAFHEGMWKADEQLISTLNSTNTEIMYLIDLYGNPCKVPRIAFRDIVIQRWQETMNKWHSEYTLAMQER